MTDWREKCCGTIPLRTALEGGQPRLDMTALRAASDRMSCGGVYVPGWQQRVFDSVDAADASEANAVPTIHLAAGGEILRVSGRGQVTAITKDAAHSIDSHQVNTEAMLQELDYLWNKHQN